MELSGLKNLTTLVITCTRVTVEGMRELRALQKLGNLWFPFPPRDDVLKVLRENGQLRAMLRAGEIGIVYRARQVSLGRVVALKMLCHAEDDPDTLAAAEAESGNFLEALKWARKAIELGFHDQNARQRLTLYEAGKPFRG